MTQTTLEELKERKQTLLSLIERFKKLYDKKMAEHEDHVQRSYFAVTTGILSILNKSTKASATYRRSLNSDIQLHRKIQLRNLFLLRMRERAFCEDLEAVNQQLAEMGYVEEPVITQPADETPAQDIELDATESTSAA